jgi:hypothetical protein
MARLQYRPLLQCLLCTVVTGSGRWARPARVTPLEKLFLGGLDNSTTKDSLLQ